jgi:hypothetical protein
VSGDFNEEARRALREATALSKRLIAETRQIKAECDARVLDSLIAMFRSDALVCASKIEQRRRKLDDPGATSGHRQRSCASQVGPPAALGHRT